MPEFPDVEIYVERLTDFVGGKRLQRIRFNSPFVLRSVEPPIGDAHNRLVERVSRLGKQIVITLEDDLHLVIHLMISGRLRWKKPASNIPKGMGLAAFDFESGGAAVHRSEQEKTGFAASGPKDGHTANVEPRVVSKSSNRVGKHSTTL